MSAEQIEAVAQAIRDAAANRTGKGRKWKALPEAVRQAYRTEARAAIAAWMRCQLPKSG